MTRYTQGAFALLLFLLQATASTEAYAIDLITSASQLSSNAYDTHGEGSVDLLANLIDGDVSTFWHSAYRGSDPANGMHYLQATLNEVVKEGEFMNVRIAFRNSGIYRDFPTNFDVYVSLDGTTWYKNCLWSVKYMGPGQYNTSPNIRLMHDAQYVRLTCTSSFIPHVYNNNTYWSFALAELQMTTEHATTVSTGDPFAGKANYSDNLEGFSYRHTMSILDASNGNNTTVGNYKQWWLTGGYDADGKWTRDSALLAQVGVQMPDFSFFTSATDSRIKSGERQAAHIQEHTVYVMPGKPILLQPYSDIRTCANYHENFIRWYDYGTDKASPNLAPTYEDWLLMKNDNGIFGSTMMTINSYYDVSISGPAQYKNFVQRVNQGEETLSAILVGDIDFAGQTVEPIGTPEHPYRGRFNGDGHTIKNLVMKGTDRVGMFGNVAGGAIIKNVILDSSCKFTGTKYVAPVAFMEKGGYEKKTVKIENFVSEGTYTATETDAGGIFGTNVSGDTLEMACCLSAGTVEVKGAHATAAGIATWVGSKANGCRIKNSYCCATVTNAADASASPFVRAQDAGIYTLDNCYDANGNITVTVGDDDIAVGTADFPVTNNRLDRRFWDQVTTRDYPMPNLQYDREGRYYGSNNRALGTQALYCVPAGEEVQEVTIAADISQQFEATKDKNLDRANKSMAEPVLMVRHLFNIKDARRLADELSSSPESNARYIQDHRRKVYARAGVDFQIRLDTPMPGYGTGPIHIWYKDSEGNYRQALHWGMIAYDSEGNEVKNMFDSHASFTAESVRTTGGLSEQDNHITYEKIADNGRGTYARFIKCLAANAKEGTYTVKLYARDEAGQIIKIAGSDKPLEFAEYVVTFEPESRASFVNTATLASDKYRYHTEEYLTAKYGEPQAKVDYDEYRQLEDPTGLNNDYICDAGKGGGIAYSYKHTAKTFLWPRQWEYSSYGYGYDQRHDYAMYVVTNNSLATPYAAAAQAVTSEENFGKGECLRDRLFYNTQGAKSGYFYYVNAASDPGVCATARIDKICAGSTVHVSAWVSEFSTAAEVANLILNFQAHLNDGRTVVLHSFVTGYVEKSDIGHWVHVYYSFIPRLSEYDVTSADVKYYSVTLENNCLSSSGADYAVDDIRVYVSKPAVSSQQIEPVCSEKIALKTKIYTPLGEMLAANGLLEAATAGEGRKIDLFYCFIDKESYDQARASGKTGEEAFESAVLRYEYMPGKGKDQAFGKLSFNTHYDSNPEYSEEQGVTQEACRATIDGDRCLCFNTFPQDGNLKPGREYYVAIYTEDDNILNPVTNPGAAEFNIEDDCAKTCVMRVRSSAVIKVDGVTEQNIDEITVCENQQPTVQVDLWGKSADGDGGLQEVEKNAHFDWYAGSSAEFYAEQSADGISLADVLAYFREEYPESATLDVEPRGLFTEAMRQYLLGLSSDRDAAGNSVTPRLSLYLASYTFPPVSRTAEYVYVMAVPINKTYGNMLVCTIPTEVRLRVFNHAPYMTDGFVQIDSYPESMTDVPLRIGLDQLEAVSAPVAQAKEYARHLTVPVKTVQPVTEGATDMVVANDDNVYLSATNDPRYKNLQTDPDNASANGLLPVGVLQTITATKGGEENQFDIVFYSDQFQFQEGYYYTLKFGFDEKIAQMGQNPCSGELVFTLKVVPKYQKWTGEENANWNNDANWTRVSSADLYRQGDVSQDAHVTDGTNANAASYAPLDFTHAIIASGVPAPRMYGMATTDVSLPGTGTYPWPSTPAEDEAGNAQPAPTTDVQYDMAAMSAQSGHVLCRPWYANTCQEINFRPSSEILGQQHLAYDKAWVEVALATGRWYTLGSPLKAVVAGDMYLPTLGARQETELFQPITFSTDTYNRFNPAVYQRAWNKAQATVYELDGSSRNVAVSTMWSHVYNDVDEDYSHGEGFSIKVDASRQPTDVGEALLRLPKDDASYSYYTDYTTGNVTGNDTPIDRKGGAYHLNDASGTLTAQSAGDSRYFLIANPFMAHLDMKEFLSRNSDKVNPKYWILTSDAQQAAVMDPSVGSFVGNMADAGYVAPMQSFFVEAKADARSLELAYDESMMQVDVTDGAQDGWLMAPPYRRDAAPTRSASVPDALRITALAAGQQVSQALVSVRQGAAMGYDESEDVALIRDDMQDGLARVYTVAGNMATDINTLPRVDSTEVGLLAEAGEAVTLRFDQVDETLGLYLYDRLTGQETTLTEGMDYPVSGAVAGRLYLCQRSMAPAAQGIEIAVEGGVLVVTDRAGTPLTVHVYTPSGTLAGTLTSECGCVRSTLPRGVYVVEAQGESAKDTKTILIP